MRFPLLPTLIVAAAVAAMIALGIWQLRRAEEKTALIAHYRAAAGQPPVAWPALPRGGDSLLYRRASGFCTEVTGWRSVAGRNMRGESGWSHIAACRTGGMEGPGMQVDAGWSRDHHAPQGWRGGPVSGTIAPDRHHRIRLIADTAAPGLQPSAAPNPEDLPNNHLLYAFQWFFFALTAAVIYILALRRRQRVADAAPKP
ncbi:MAG: surfeit locus 1 family protein [Sphingomonadales bacterium]|nr:surfeit locus 1 family protein [Sphingomonadales bacterium]